MIDRELVRAVNEVCPDDFSMASCAWLAPDMVNRGKMPPAAHEFARETGFSNGPDFAIRAPNPVRHVFPPLLSGAATRRRPGARFPSLRFPSRLVAGVWAWPLACCGAPRWAGRQAWSRRSWPPSGPCGKAWAGRASSPPAPPAGLFRKAARTPGRCPCGRSQRRDGLPEGRRLHADGIWPFNDSCNARHTPRPRPPCAPFSENAASPSRNCPFRSLHRMLRFGGLVATPIRAGQGHHRTPGAASPRDFLALRHVPRPAGPWGNGPTTPRPAFPGPAPPIRRHARSRLFPGTRPGRPFAAPAGHGVERAHRPKRRPGRISRSARKAAVLEPPILDDDVKRTLAPRIDGTQVAAIAKRPFPGQLHRPIGTYWVEYAWKAPRPLFAAYSHRMTVAAWGSRKVGKRREKKERCLGGRGDNPRDPLEGVNWSGGRDDDLFTTLRGTGGDYPPRWVGHGGATPIRAAGCTT